MLLGVHCSIAGGLINAFGEMREKEIDTFQIFTKNQRQWKEKTIDEVTEGESFKAALKNTIAFSHCSYLFNLASMDEEIRKKSILGLGAELLRCHDLGLQFTVLHPGAHKDTKEGISMIAEGLNIVLNNSEYMKVKALLEITAGAGSSVGGKFEHLRDIMNMVDSNRIGICFDTCHAFAAGYDIRTQSGFEDTLAKLDKIIGLKKLHVFHLNDSKGELGSHLDRHENIGEGKIGLEPFRVIMNKFKHIPKVIETPKEFDKKNLEVLRGLAS
ncbi:MAG: deoxyribonuclease IV [Cytophagaceae bacterium]|nr:deoxyribonuclease IV [Cytophagaceae bacterium]